MARFKICQYDLAICFSIWFNDFQGEYEANICDPKNSSCLPCPARLPSCKGLPDGMNSLSNKQWTATFIVCVQNRTLDINKCKTGYFNPRTRKCMEHVEKGLPIRNTIILLSYAYVLTHNHFLNCFSFAILESDRSF